MPANASRSPLATLLTFTTLGALLAGATSCGSSPPPATAEPEPTEPTDSRTDAQREADALLGFYTPALVALFAESSRASWAASTDVNDHNTGLRTGAETAVSAFTGNARFIEAARSLLARRDELDDSTARQLRVMLQLAASAPMTAPDLARARIAAESAQAARLDGYEFCLDRPSPTSLECDQPLTANQIDDTLRGSRDLEERLRVWRASKDIGYGLKDGLAELQGLRNGVAREMGYDDFFAFKVDDYGMTTAEMMAMLDRLVEETRPLLVQLHCWTRHELAARYGVEEVPELIPAHWIANRWAQRWPGVVEGVDNDALVEGRSKEWIVQQAERFYVSMGFPELPETFWTLSDLYPVPEGEPRRKNAHASAWHLDLDQDVRSLMSVKADWDWFGTTHHELGHIYYFLAYSTPEVPPLLREGANRAYHEAIGNLIEHAAGQQPYLAEIGLRSDDEAPEEIPALLDSALNGPIVFLPWAAGVMSHYEKELYADELPRDRYQDRWWELVARYQGVAPPDERPAEACDACSKTHINDDPAEYYDYALADVLVYQLHDHICRELLGQDPRSCNYYGRPEAGEFLQAIMEVGATRDWREVLREHTGSDLTAEPMLEYYRPLLAHLEEQNAGRQCGDWAE